MSNKSFASKDLYPHWPSEHVDDFVDFVGIVPGDVATITIEAESFVRVFIYKMKCADPIVKVSKKSDHD